MPLQISDIHLRLSVPAATVGNATPQASPSLSLGKYISTTDIVNATLNNLFDDIAASTPTEYRCFFVYNAHLTSTLFRTKVWLSTVTTDGATCSLGVDPVSASLVGSSSVQAGNTSAGVTFTTPLSYSSGLELGNLPPSSCRAVWVRRTSLGLGPINLDRVVISVQGETGDE